MTFAHLRRSLSFAVGFIQTFIELIRFSQREKQEGTGDTENTFGHHAFIILLRTGKMSNKEVKRQVCQSVYIITSFPALP